MAILAQLIDDVVVHKFELPQGETRIGRGTDSDIVVAESAVSTEHANVSLTPNPYFSEYLEAYIEDCGSTNGTFLNDKPLAGRQRLHNNDVIRVAWNKFRFIDESEAEMEKTVHMMKNQTP